MRAAMSQAEVEHWAPANDKELHGERWHRLNYATSVPMAARREVLARERAEAAERLAQHEAKEVVGSGTSFSDLEGRVAGLEQALSVDLIKALGQILPQFVAKKVAPLVARLKTLEARVDELEEREAPDDIERRLAALEARPAGLVYRGVWREDQAAHYAKGDLCTHGGGAWIATSIPTNRPGVGDSGWTLAVKSANPQRKPPVLA
jgi:hypothetical protein